ncbi:MAG: hypothetical protein H8E42_09280 [Nitrospinae bacterium]|nr:hypothetical protein [Nitrospinota bacterium]MBL7020698.1 hypothetical protein [Nitrospinaceae bacterium]
MKIKMLKTRQGSLDGIIVNTYVSGETVDVPDELARVFIVHRWAKKVIKTSVKNQSKAPENKTIRRGASSRRGNNP